jgi:monovalent cation/hydrogen antiporter
LKIATYNVNGINGRLDGLLRWLSESRPDIVCLQELKAPNDKFPEGALNKAGYGATWWLVLYVVAITLALLVLRYVWVWVSLELTLFRAKRGGMTRQHPGWRVLAAFSVAGVRGAITLAGILTLPLMLTDQQPFPARDLAIFLAAGVIVLSLIIGSLVLPPLLKGIDAVLPETTDATEEDRARRAANDAAVKAIEKKQREVAEGQADIDIYAAAAERAMDVYRLRMAESLRSEEEVKLSKRVESIARTLRLEGFKAEREEIYRLARNHELEETIARRIVREIDLMEARYSG